MEFIEILEDGTAAPAITNMTVETMPNENLVSAPFSHACNDLSYW